MFKEILISDSYAQEAATAAATQDAGLMSFLPLILIFAIFYLLIIRPQSKKMKEHQDLVKALKVGTQIVTNGGFLGVIRKANEGSDEIEVEIADGVVVKMLRHYVSDVSQSEKEKLAKKQQDKNKK